jgi:hypothetical protein
MGNMGSIPPRLKKPYSSGFGADVKCCSAFAVIERRTVLQPERIGPPFRYNNYKLYIVADAKRTLLPVSASRTFRRG